MISYVIVAEDDDFLNETMSMVLQENGAEVFSAMDGEQAMQAMDERQPDAMLLDYLMPKADGMEVLKHYQEKGYNFPIIMLSNMSNDSSVDECKALGAVDYLVKSDMDEDELWPMVSKHLGFQK